MRSRTGSLKGTYKEHAITVAQGLMQQPEHGDAFAPIAENQMDKKIENTVEAKFFGCLSG